MKIIDCFMYFDGNLRNKIKYFEEVVDKFVICEATKDHRMKKTKFQY